MCVHDWDGFGRLLKRAAPDVLENVKSSPATAARAIQLIKKWKPNFLFIHFDDVDHAGHEFEWKSPKYFEAVEMIDALIADVFSALKDARIYDRTVLFITADHGGLGKKHGGESMVELQIPFIVHGTGVAKRRELLGPVNTYDLAPTIAWVLGLDAPPAWIGRPIVEAFD
jgi:arylsulfatase A-like enzyme